MSVLLLHLFPDLKEIHRKTYQTLHSFCKLLLYLTAQVCTKFVGIYCVLTFLSCLVMFIPSLISASFFCILLFLVRCMCLQHYVFSSTSIDNKRTWHMRIHKGNTIFLITLIVLCRIFQPDHRMYMGVSPCAGILPGRSSLLFIKENNSCKIVNSNFQKSKNSTFVTFWPVIAMYSR